MRATKISVALFALGGLVGAVPTGKNPYILIQCHLTKVLICIEILKPRDPTVSEDRDP